MNEMKQTIQNFYAPKTKGSVWGAYINVNTTTRLFNTRFAVLTIQAPNKC